MKTDGMRVRDAQESGAYIFSDGRELQLKEVRPRIYERYIDEVVTPVVHNNQQIGKDAAARVENAENVLTRRPLNPIIVAVHGNHFLQNFAARPQIPPPAIKHVSASGVAYELIDEQHVGMAYFAVHEDLTVYVVETVTYDE